MTLEGSQSINPGFTTYLCSYVPYKSGEAGSNLGEAMQSRVSGSVLRGTIYADVEPPIRLLNDLT
jgi:hypothetical protein